MTSVFFLPVKVCVELRNELVPLGTIAVLHTHSHTHTEHNAKGLKLLRLWTILSLNLPRFSGARCGCGGEWWGISKPLLWNCLWKRGGKFKRESNWKCWHREKERLHTLINNEDFHLISSGKTEKWQTGYKEVWIESSYTKAVLV